MKIPAVYTVEELVSFHEELLAATGMKEVGSLYPDYQRRGFL
jgi:hypothetical protein